MAFTPDGDRLATAGEDRTVSQRHARTGAIAGPSRPRSSRVAASQSRISASAPPVARIAPSGA
ncbi:MAG: hypothetical protein ACKON7_00535 [Planctomycetaceae bacterium]